MKKYLIIIVCVILIALGAWYFGFSKKAKDQAFSVVFPANYAEAVEIKSAEASLRIVAKGAKGVNGIKEGNEPIGVIRYIDAYANADVVQKIESSRLKEDIVLKAAGHPDVFKWEINLSDFEHEIDEQNNIVLSSKLKAQNSKPKELAQIFKIPAPFMVDAEGKRSSIRDVKVKIEGNVLTLAPDSGWIKAHKYPITLDPTVEISVLNLYSHPEQGEDWTVEFTTVGTADLYIIPNDQATVEDDQFVSLWCGDEQRFPSPQPSPAGRGGTTTEPTLALPLQKGGGAVADTIYVENWSCDQVGKVVHQTLKAGNHTLKFQFGDAVAYAYNHWNGGQKYAWGENVGWVNASSTYEKVMVASEGLTGYAWGENIGWIKFDYDGVAGATNTSATDWGVTNDGAGNLGGYAWGENVGWINFWASSSRVTIDYTTGKFSGYAWGENIGWVNFGHTLTGAVSQFWPLPPSVVTEPPMNVASRVATFKANFISGGATITSWGFKYGLTQADTWTTGETGTSTAVEYKRVAENLQPNTTYYVRAYAVNSEGTTTGAWVQFTTQANEVSSPVVFKGNMIFNGDFTQGSHTAFPPHVFSCGEKMRFNGLIYGTVSINGQCWMDRNLGATRAATAYNDWQSYGYLYQWGRLSDGHQATSSAATTTLATSDIPGHSQFIKNGSSPYDWRNPQNDNLWATSSGSINNPCPTGWHVPLQTEWNNVVVAMGLSSCSSNCLKAAASSALKLSAAGFRGYSTGAMNLVGSNGSYWSSTITGTSAYILNFYSTAFYSAVNYYRAYGYSVRCLQN